mmetsp:Transcript_50016/g.161802  ORF Transcript_50016/g.161802 Transcript_50016/m.161802 type:complete len:222 (+) Transcript_50016:567-1232(+)
MRPCARSGHGTQGIFAPKPRAKRPRFSGSPAPPCPGRAHFAEPRPRKSARGGKASPRNSRNFPHNSTRKRAVAPGPPQATRDTGNPASGTPRLHRQPRTAAPQSGARVARNVCSGGHCGAGGGRWASCTPDSGTRRSSAHPQPGRLPTAAHNPCRTSHGHKAEYARLLHGPRSWHRSGTSLRNGWCAEASQQRHLRAECHGLHASLRRRLARLPSHDESAA